MSRVKHHCLSIHILPTLSYSLFFWLALATGCAWKFTNLHDFAIPHTPSVKATSKIQGHGKQAGCLSSSSWDERGKRDRQVHFCCGASSGSLAVDALRWLPLLQLQHKLNVCLVVMARALTYALYGNALMSTVWQVVHVVERLLVERLYGKWFM